MSELNLVTKGYMDAKIDDAALFLLDKIYPVGSVVFGNHPDVGTWELLDLGGVLYADAALEDGATLTEALPNISMGSSKIAMITHGNYNHSAGPMTFSGSGYTADYSGTSFKYGGLDFNASKADATYGAATQTGYKVQMKGTNLRAYKRTA